MLDHLLNELKNTGYLEYIAVLAGVTQVLLARKNNVLLYPFGILSTSLSIYIFVDVKLYAEALLHLYYVVISIYGWYVWIRPKNQSVLPITKSTRRDYRITAMITLISFGVLYTALVLYTDSTTPVWDSVVSAFAWSGTWLLTQRKVENWIVLNISNIIAIPLQWHKGIYLYAILTTFLFIVAITGYIAWKKELKNELN
ncbi:nicotinamide riboside transporter PnuC [Gynurincola endophyticus]|jgi:nicotinamide mononucleotide transporter|uniref:nicotinamide riboside transporter PnuC n=1 Tax=Gynurincola endophyticus TaxID=2479004 RepID=UPI000F8C456C|nr:nicotinamide riboside transporter PnuC [Gynurincola endophyticus]